VLAVPGSKTSTPKRCDPAYAAASARFFTTERVRVGGAILNETSGALGPGRRGPPALDPLGEQVVRALLEHHGVVDAGVLAGAVVAAQQAPARQRAQRARSTLEVRRCA
jgi:hypothetical protein